MKKMSIIVLSLMLALVLTACKKEVVTTTGTTAAIRPNLNQFRVDLANDIIEKQSTDVDTISGATDSSLGWIKAVERALEKAESTTNPDTYIDGTYTGEGDKRQFGYEDATVVITNGSITSVTLRRLNSNGSEVDYTQWTGK